MDRYSWDQDIVSPGATWDFPYEGVVGPALGDYFGVHPPRVAYGTLSYSITLAADRAPAISSSINRNRLRQNLSIFMMGQNLCG